MALMFTTGTNLPCVDPPARGLHLNNFLHSPCPPRPPTPPLPVRLLASRLSLTPGPLRYWLMNRTILSRHRNQGSSDLRGEVQ